MIISVKKYTEKSWFMKKKQNTNGNKQMFIFNPKSGVTTDD